MQLKFKLLLVLLIPFTGYSQFNIEGEILDKENIKDIEIFINVGMDFNRRFPANIKNNSFSISGELKEPINSMLVINNNGERRSVKILLDSKSTYKIDILLKDDPDILGEEWFRIRTNSEFHNVWREFYDNQARLFAKKRKVKNNFESGKITKSELDERVLTLEQEINEEFKVLAIENPSNYAVAYILNGAPDLSREYIIYYEMLDEQVRKSYWGRNLKETLDGISEKSMDNEDSKPILGTVFQKIEGMTINGKKVKYSMENMESRLTLLDFWASWCAPCRKENIYLGRLNSEYSSSNLKIISFSLDSNSKNWKKASLKDNIIWENISDLQGVKSKIMQDFQIRELPRNLLIDSDGKIVAVNKFGDDLKKFINAFLSI